MSFRNSKARALIAAVLMIAVSAVFLYAQKQSRADKPPAHGQHGFSVRAGH